MQYLKNLYKNLRNEFSLSKLAIQNVLERESNESKEKGA